MAAVGGCLAEEVRAGQVRRSPAGLGTVWLKCPATAAKKISGIPRILVE